MLRAVSSNAVLPCGCTDSLPAAIAAARALLPPELQPPPAAASDSECELERWAASGGMHITGDARAPAVSPAPVLTHATAALRVAGLDHAAATLLFGRAALLGLRRAGRFSPGGTCRLVRTADWWAAVSLSRPEDIASVPAIVGEELVDDDDPIGMLDAAARRWPAEELAARCQLFGVPAAALASAPARPALVFDQLGERRDDPVDAPLVVDLSSLWAGPLCARLLADAGARVVKVESTQRPDGARRGSAPFYDWLHAGHSSVAIDFATADGRAQLRQLVERADIVIEASRPRALRGLGIDAEAVVAHRPGTTWISITGYGRTGGGEHLVAFGDDAAVAGALVAFDDEREPVFCGDAIADPLTGVFAALAALRSHRAGGGYLVDVAMSAVAAHTVTAVEHRMGDHSVEEEAGRWTVQHGGRTLPVEEPRPPAPAPAAEPLGASNARLAELLGA